MRTGLPYSIAFSIITANCASRLLPLPTLPGIDPVLRERRAQSGYSASSLWPLKWKSPTSGTPQPSASSRSRIAGTAPAASAVLTVMRTSSEPASASALTWATVAATSAVSVLVIDCTTTGAPPPIGTPATSTCRVRRRSMRVAGSLMRVLGGDASLQREAGDVLPRVGREVDRLPFQVSVTSEALPITRSKGGAPVTPCVVPPGFILDSSTWPWRSLTSVHEKSRNASVSARRRRRRCRRGRRGRCRWLGDGGRCGRGRSGAGRGRWGAVADSPGGAVPAGGIGAAAGTGTAAGPGAAGEAIVAGAVATGFGNGVPMTSGAWAFAAGRAAAAAVSRARHAAPGVGARAHPFVDRGRGDDRDQRHRDRPSRPARLAVRDGRQLPDRRRRGLQRR